MLVLLVFLLFAGTASAGQTYHVRANGDDTRCAGDSQCPWKTLAHAVLKARAGDTVLIGPGRFSERLHFQRRGNLFHSITYRGTRGAKGEYETIIDGSTPVASEWQDAGDGIYKTQLGYDPKAMSAQGYGIWRCGYDSIESGRCQEVMAYSSDKEINTNSGGPVKFWDGIEALFRYQDGWTYLRFRNREHPRDMQVRAAPSGGAITINNAGTILEHVKVVGGQYAVRVAEGAHGTVIQDSYLSHGKHRVLIEGGAEGTIIRRNILTYDGIGFRDPALPAGDWNNTSYARLINRRRYDENKFLIGDTETDDSSIEFRNDSNTIVTQNIIRDSVAGITFHGSTTNADVSYNQIIRHSDNCVYINADWASVNFHHNLLADCDHLMRFQSTQRNMKWSVYANSFWQPPGTGKHIFMNGPDHQPNDSVIAIYQNSHAGTGWAVDVGSDGQHISLPFVYVGNMLMSVDDISSWGDVSWGTMEGIYRDSLWYGTTSVPDFKLPSNSGAVNSAQMLSDAPGMTEQYYVDNQPDYGSTQGGQGISTPPPPTPTDDTTPPTVQITTPLSGARISGSVPVSARASDNKRIAGVQFTLDDQPLGSEQCCTSVDITVDSTKISDGRHILKAVARDEAGNRTTSAPVEIIVANGTTPPPTSTGLNCTGDLLAAGKIALNCVPK